VVGGAVIGRAPELKERLAFLQNAAGGSQSALDSFLVLRGTKTLHLRMARHQENALGVARFLETRAEVAEVIYPGLPSHPQHALARRQMSGFGGMVSFVLRGDGDGGGGGAGDSVALARARGFLRALRVFTCAESLGGVESLAEHPAIMTHASLPPDRRAALGIGDGLIRLSVGVEHLDDLLADLDRGLGAAR
jgi:cystathionine gamma-lyase